MFCVSISSPAFKPTCVAQGGGLALPDLGAGPPLLCAVHRLLLCDGL